LRPAASEEKINSIELIGSISYYHCESFDGGWRAYICLARLMKLLSVDIPLKGYFYINDDVVWSYSKIIQLNPENIWYPLTASTVDIDSPPDTWHWP
jgi:hypothetical protein